jgi:hypothetical protein
MNTGDAGLLSRASDSIEDDLLTSALTIVHGADGKVVARRDGGELVVRTAAGETKIQLRPIRQLFVGNERAPDLSRGPTPKLMPLFAFLEVTILRFCEAEGRDETDQEMERIFSLLKRRPDSLDGPLHAYVRNAAQVFMALRDVSQAEYEAVLGRLAKSARTFAFPPISRNYLHTLRQTFPE